MLKNRLLIISLSIITLFSVLFCQLPYVAAVEDQLKSATEEAKPAADEEKETKASDKKADDKKAEETAPKKGQKPVIPENETAILIDGISGTVLFEKDADRRMYPASTTKVMTAIVAFEAIERGEFSKDDMILVTEEMLADADIDGSNIALKPGEEMSLHNLIKGMLIASGNDAASAIATHIGGTKSAFVDMMNAKASELGLSNTHFVNPDGIHNDDHYTTASDMAKIALYAMKKFDFRDIVDCAHIKIPPTNLSPERYYINTNGLLSTMRYLDYAYKGANGVKTGYTGKAGNCLVSSVKRDRMEFIGVLFGGKDVIASHKDSIQMFDWAFENLTSATPILKGSLVCEIKVRQGKGTDSIPLSAATDGTVIIPNGTNTDDLEFKYDIPEYTTAPVKENDKIGSVTITHNGQPLTTCDLLASTNVDRSFFWPVMAVGSFLWENTITRILVILVLIAVALFLLLFIAGIYKNLKRAGKHRKARHDKER